MNASTVAAVAAVIAAVAAILGILLALREQRAQRQRWVEEDSRLPALGRASFEVHLGERLGRNEWRDLKIHNIGKAPFYLDRVEFRPGGSELCTDTGERFPRRICCNIEAGTVKRIVSVKPGTFEKGPATEDGFLQFFAAGAVFEVSIVDASAKPTAARKVRDED